MSEMIAYANVASMAFNKPLLATSEVADVVTTFLKNKITGTINDSLMSVGSVDNIPLGSPEDGASITVIPVHGILVPRRFVLNDACEEMMSYELLRTRISKALKDDSVTEIVLDFQTGGGTAQAAFETADFIFESRSIKPIRAIINYNAFSGGYLLAAACTEIIVSETSGVGSIGVYQKRVDLTQALNEQGFKVHTFSRGARKVDGHPDVELSEEEITATELSIETTYKRFVSAVSRYRDMSESDVISTEAECYEGQDAINLGLADRLASPQDAINQISQHVAISQGHSAQITVQTTYMEMMSKL